MFPDLITYGAVVLVGLTAIYILIAKDWRYCVLALAVQYIGVFVLVDASWPIDLAVVKMVAGWMSGAILGIAMASLPAERRNLNQSIKFGSLFRILAAIIITLTIASLVLQSGTWFPLFKTTVIWGSFLLIGFGILQLSLASSPLRVIIGLLTALSGFEIIYAAMETSALVTGLLAGVNLGLALAGAYLLVAPSMESNP
jgi:hypothetical protein